MIKPLGLNNLQEAQRKQVQNSGFKRFYRTRDLVSLLNKVEEKNRDEEQFIDSNKFKAYTNYSLI